MTEVSVIIPTYNRSRKLRRAVKSVLNQTYEDFKLIIVDDHSTDDTPKIVQNFKDKRIRYHRNSTNLGGSGARNKGIKLSNNKFLAFLDDDDEWLPTKLEKQVRVLQRSDPNYCGVYTGMKIIKDGKVKSNVVRNKEGNLFEELLKKNVIGSTSVVLLKKDCITDVGGFNENLPASQERELYLSLSKKYKFRSIPECLVKHHIHSGNRITDDKEKKLKSKKYIYNKYKEQIQKYSNLHASHLFTLGVLEMFNGNKFKATENLKKAYMYNPKNFKYKFFKYLLKYLPGIRYWTKAFLNIRNYKSKLNK